MDTLTIRPARPDDLAPLDQLFARAYPRLLRPHYPPSVMVLALPHLARAQPALLASGSYFLAEDRGTILGAGGWTPMSRRRATNNATQGQIRHVVTDPGHIRRGIGRRLLQQAIAQARARGITAMSCQSTLMAVPFYESLGFQVLGRIEVPLGPGILFPAVQMQARL